LAKFIVLFHFLQTNCEAPVFVTVQSPDVVALALAVKTKVFALVNETTEKFPSVALPEVKSTVIESLANN